METLQTLLAAFAIVGLAVIIRFQILQFRTVP